MNISILITLLVNTIFNLLLQYKVLPENSVYVNLILTAVLIVYVGTLKDNIKINDDFIKEQPVIDKKMAYFYPLILSFVLLSIYLIIKFLPKYKQVILGILFYSSVITSLITLLDINPIIIIISVIAWFIFTSLTKQKYNNIKIYVNNILAILVSLSSIKTINSKNILTTVILLSGLFLFDIFWVFGSKKIGGESVMENVASNVDAPIMLKFFTGNDTKNTIILGLGDIVLPALFIKQLNTKPFYYIQSLVSYAIGLIFTVVSAVVFKNGQPALLYIVPSLFLPFFISLVAKKDLDMLNT